MDATCFYGHKSNSSFVSNGVRYISSRIIMKVHGAPLLLLGNLRFLYYGIKSNLIIFQEPYPFLWPSIFLLKCLFQKKVIVLIHADPAANKFIKLIYKLARLNVFRGTACVTTSPNVQASVTSIMYKYNEIIPLCIPDAPSCSTDLDLDLPDTFVLYFGRLANYKGIDVLIETAMRMPQVNFVIAGDGPLRTLVRDASLTGIGNIVFINKFITEEEKMYLIDKSLFVVFPSTSANEAFGLVQLEAMRAGKPLINTDLNTGVNFVAPHMVCALTVKPNCPKDLEDAIRRLSQSIVLRAELGENGKDRFKRLFSIDAFEKAWTNILRKCLND
jgi:glycosyltransferase involved in cell wall biosynthesis